MKKLSMAAALALTVAAPAIAQDASVSGDPFLSTQQEITVATTTTTTVTTTTLVGGITVGTAVAGALGLTLILGVLGGDGEGGTTTTSTE